MEVPRCSRLSRMLLRPHSDVRRDIKEHHGKSQSTDIPRWLNSASSKLLPRCRSWDERPSQEDALSKLLSSGPWPAELKWEPLDVLRVAKADKAYNIHCNCHTVESKASPESPKSR